MIVTITGLTERGKDTPIQAIKALRQITGAGLRWAKMEVYDNARDGNPVPNINLANMDEVTYLREFWEITVESDGMSAVIVKIPAVHKLMVEDLIRALGGSVEQR